MWRSVPFFQLKRYVLRNAEVQRYLGFVWVIWQTSVFSLFPSTHLIHIGSSLSSLQTKTFQVTCVIIISAKTEFGVSGIYRFPKCFIARYFWVLFGKWGKKDTPHMQHTACRILHTVCCILCACTLYAVYLMVTHDLHICYVGGGILLMSKVRKVRQLWWPPPSLL